jgi:hypothetical protein
MKGIFISPDCVEEDILSLNDSHIDQGSKLDPNLQSITDLTS